MNRQLSPRVSAFFPAASLLCGLACLLCLLCAACAAQRPSSPDTQDTPDAAAPPQGQAASLVAASARTLAEMRAASTNRLLDYALEDARAVIVLPGIYQAGFIYSLRAGNGVLVARRDDGGWGAPIFISFGGAGYGPQIGLEKSRLVLVVQDDEELERILTGGFTFDAAVKYDIVGVREEHGPGTLTEGRPVLAISDGVGIMAGVALHGGGLTVDRSLTAAYHGQDAGTVERILKGTSAPGLEVFQLWSTLVVDLPQDLIQRGNKP